MSTLLMKSVCCLLFVTLCKCGVLKNKCRRVLPQENVDWSKLQGEWLNLMFVPASREFVSCREMRVSGANKEKKVVNMDFTYISYGSESEAYRREEFHFKWYSNPGLIHTTLKGNSKMQKKKGTFKSKSVISHTVASTDYQNYMILLQCNKAGAREAWISLRNPDISEDLAKTLQDQMKEYGFPLDRIHINKGKCS